MYVHFFETSNTRCMYLHVIGQSGFKIVLEWGEKENKMRGQGNVVKCIEVVSLLFSFLYLIPFCHSISLPSPGYSTPNKCFMRQSPYPLLEYYSADMSKRLYDTSLSHIHLRPHITQPTTSAFSTELR